MDGTICKVTNVDGTTVFFFFFFHFMAQLEHHHATIIHKVFTQLSHLPNSHTQHSGPPAENVHSDPDCHSTSPSFKWNNNHP